MEILFQGELIKALREAGAKSQCFTKEPGGYSYARNRQIDTKNIDPKDYELVKKVCRKAEYWSAIDNRRVVSKLEALEALGKKYDEETEVKKLEVLPDALRLAIESSPKRWLFLDSQGVLMPYFVESAKFHAGFRRSHEWHPPHVDVTLTALVRGKKKGRSLTFHAQDVKRTVPEILKLIDAFLATDELVEAFAADTKKYDENAPCTGEQYLATGSGVLGKEDRWYSRETVSFTREGKPSRVVMDDSLDYGDDGDLANVAWWHGKGEDSDDEEDAESEAQDVEILPTHPIVRVFNLNSHEYVDCHISCLEPYVYDEGLIDKLVLPDSTKSLIDALTGSAIRKLSDIIKGKAQGVIILCSGEPGTGKTLTGEVYSEAAKRPLYVVQCSQLGTDEEALEKHLGTVLERATRWRAILLIDEADVYIHERGESIRQNAIVGVFLRLLEYYNGILFLTTNRVTVVDDAILSRATAHVKYRVPKGGDRIRLWEILLEQYGIEAQAGLVHAAIKAFPKVSGRSIRQLIRLGLTIAQSQDEDTLNVGHLRQASKFHDFAPGQRPTKEQDGAAEEAPAKKLEKRPRAVAFNKKARS